MDGSHFLRFATKFVFGILPAALASVIGGFLFTQYPAARPPEPKSATLETVAPAQMEEAMRMVREEHSLIVDFLKAQQQATEKRNAAFDQARTKAAAESREAALREAALRDAANREAAREAASREAAEKMAALRRREAETAKLRPAFDTTGGKPAVELATIAPVRAPLPNAPAANASSNDLRPPADIPNEPRRQGPIGATIGFARDITSKAVSTVLEIPAWLGDQILGPSTPAPSGRLTSAQW